jgi:hypothetical protein
MKFTKLFSAAIIIAAAAGAVSVCSAQSSAEADRFDNAYIL